MQIAIINLFATLEYRFPNMVKAVVRRESVRKAYEVGITAEQVCRNRVRMTGGNASADAGSSLVTACGGEVREGAQLPPNACAPAAEEKGMRHSETFDRMMPTSAEPCARASSRGGLRAAGAGDSAHRLRPDSALANGARPPARAAGCASCGAAPVRAAGAHERLPAV